MKTPWFIVFTFLGSLALLALFLPLLDQSAAQEPQPTHTITPTPAPPELLPTPSSYPADTPITIQETCSASTGWHDCIILSTTGWQQTPLILQQGDDFTVNYLGGTWSVDYLNLPYVGPEGYSSSVDDQIFAGCKISTSAPYARLLGRIDNGPTFSVGLGGRFIANTSGTLYLRINDQDTCLGDNNGWVSMGVRAGSIDLEVISIETTIQPICSGTSVTFKAFINNSDSAESGFFDIRWNADGQLFDGGHFSIPAGTTDSHDHIWQNLTLGQHTLTFIADTNNKIPESDENNNQTTITFMAVDCSPPVANFNASPLSGDAPLVVSMYNTSSGSYTNCTWNYGDGTTNTSCDPYNDHTYTTSGSYDVSLTVSGPSGSDTETKYDYITIAGNTANYCGPMDIAFVVDTTTSMAGAIANVKAELTQLLGDIETASGNNYRLALVTFGDRINIQENFAPNNRASVEPKFQALGVSGGGRFEPEISDEALNTVVNGLPASGRPQNADFTPHFRAAALKTIILVTDARPGGFDDTFTPGVDDVNAHNRALEAGGKRFNISAVFVPTTFSPPDHPAVRSIMQDYATTTDGMFIETTADGTGTGNAIKSIIARCGTGLVDSDGDSIPDDVEENGYDYNRDGIIDVDLPGMGAKKDHKDIFVYVDWLETSSGINKHSHKPGADAINKVKQAFADAPVDNLDGVTGINLHVVFGKKMEETGINKELGAAAGECAYNWNEFDSLKNRNIDGFPASMRPLFHYVIFAHDMPMITCEGSENRPGGVSRNPDSNENFHLGASDFLLAIDRWEYFFGTINLEEQKINTIAGTFMHELGHNLGLGHGGLVLEVTGEITRVLKAEGTNYKPNHLSVMNYAFQNGGLRKRGLSGDFEGGYFDYSQFGPDVLPDLVESNLSEPDGLKASEEVQDYGTYYYCQNERKTVNGLHNKAVDWNCKNGDKESSVSANINVDKFLGTLTTVNEWQGLRYNGGAVGAFGAPVDLPMISSMEEAPELSFEEDPAVDPYRPRSKIFLPMLVKN